jgi:hypothetical protein
MCEDAELSPRLEAVVREELAERPRVRARVVDPAALSPEGRAALVDTLFEAHARAFSGIDRAAFARHVVCSAAARTRIQIYEAEGRTVGYAGVHFFRQTLRGRPVWVMRTEAGLDRAFRGRTPMSGFVVRELLLHAARHPLQPLWAMACVVHPASYRRVAAGYPRVYPAPGVELPPGVDALRHALADAFGLARVPGQPDEVRSVGWVSRETPQEAARWRAHPAPEVQLFLARNPDYAAGLGLLVVAPISVPDLTRAGARLLLRRLRGQ